MTPSTILFDEAENSQEILQLTLELRQLYREDIAQLLDLVVLDSNSTPLRYLQESMVPHGGE